MCVCVFAYMHSKSRRAGRCQDVINLDLCAELILKVCSVGCCGFKGRQGEATILGSRCWVPLRAAESEIYRPEPKGHVLLGDSPKQSPFILIWLVRQNFPVVGVL